MAGEDLPPILQAPKNPEKLSVNPYSRNAIIGNPPCRHRFYRSWWGKGGNGVVMREKKTEGVIYWRYVIFSILFGLLMLWLLLKR